MLQAYQSLPLVIFLKKKIFFYQFFQATARWEILDYVFNEVANDLGKHVAYAMRREDGHALGKRVADAVGKHVPDVLGKAVGNVAGKFVAKFLGEEAGNVVDKHVADVVAEFVKRAADKGWAKSKYFFPAAVLLKSARRKSSRGFRFPTRRNI